MCVTVRELADAMQHLAPRTLRLVARRPDSDAEVILEAFGSLIEVADGAGIVAASAGQCELMGVPVDANSQVLFGHARQLALSGPDRAVGKLIEVVVLADQTRVLHHGAECVEQIVLHEERSELWLMVACMVSASPALRILAGAAG